MSVPLRRAAPQRIGRSKKGFVPIPAQPEPVKAAPSSTDCCSSPHYDFYEGAKICTNCGTQISEQNIVAEVTFGETSTGAATVQGGFVGETARHAKTLGAAASRRIGGQYQSREETEQNGRTELRQLCPQLRISSHVEDVAFNLWKLASAQNFIQGRRTNEVAGVCLYAACRRDKQNTILLMDISEALSVNVFRLGDIYKELCKVLFLEYQNHTQPVVEVEPLLMKYCSKLEFGEQTRNVAEDAARIVKRMKRDWMVTGRHPAGLCGACIILAARMNNFRRTTREVVYVVRVSDITIATRLAEFKKTRSSTMSVQDFRNKSHRLKYQHDPPSVGAAAERQKKLVDTLKRRQARAENRMSQDGSVISSRRSSVAASDASADEETTSQSSPPAIPTPLRIDGDGFAIPNPPTTISSPVSASSPTSSTNTDDSTSRKRKRSKTDVTPVDLTEADFVTEHELEIDIEAVLRDDDCVSARNDAQRDKIQQRASQIATQQKAIAASQVQARLESQGRTTTTISDSEIISPDEFADDPEVQNVLLDEEAVKIKEKIWLRDNEDWLRAKQAKILKQELLDAEGGSDKKLKKKRKRSRMGDGTVLTEGGTPVQSPADAAQRMLEKRAGKSFSKSVDYAKLNAVFGGNVGPSESEKKRMSKDKKKEALEANTMETVQEEVAEAVDGQEGLVSVDIQHDIVQGLAEASDLAEERVERVANGIEGENAGNNASNEEDVDMEANTNDNVFVANNENNNDDVNGNEVVNNEVVNDEVVNNEENNEEDEEDEEEEADEEDDNGNWKKGLKLGGNDNNDDDNDDYERDEDDDYEAAQNDMFGF